MIRGEPPSSWLLFLTNQGTDDHIVASRVHTLVPGMSVRVSARVSRRAVTIGGGHVVIGISDGDEIDAVFYEPTGSLRNVARKLIPGDQVVVFGSVRREPRGINVEKLQVVRLGILRVKTGNPRCSVCSKRMGSLGRGQGFRCKVCGARLPMSEAELTEVPRDVMPGWYEPPVASRRHLYKPERRLSRVNINNLL
jgi:tRNA(Ile2)-agmatinylcytidine synthase